MNYKGFLAKFTKQEAIFVYVPFVPVVQLTHWDFMFHLNMKSVMLFTVRLVITIRTLVNDSLSKWLVIMYCYHMELHLRNSAFGPIVTMWTWIYLVFVHPPAVTTWHVMTMKFYAHVSYPLSRTRFLLSEILMIIWLGSIDCTSVVYITHTYRMCSFRCSFLL